MKPESEDNLAEEILKTSSSEIYADMFNDFLASSDTLRIYQGNKLSFSSNKDRLLPLVGYLDETDAPLPQVVIFDKIMGNAAALLSVKANCQEIYSPLGSQLAIKTLDKYRVEYHFTKIAPFIQKPDMEDMCPMEKLSIGKEPEEFYKLMKTILK